MIREGGGLNWRKFGTAVGQKLWSSNGRKMCAEAQRSTGLQDFGTPAPDTPLSILVNSLEEEAQLHPLGRLLMRIHLRDLLQTRLQLTDTWRENSDALDSSPLKRPVFIVGMPRSGSTFLHELLGEDPANRAPRVWEVMFPIRVEDAGKRERQRRVRRTEMCLWWFRKLARQADSVYPMRAWTPHECVAIHSYTFLSEEFVSTCRIPTYEKFLRSADRTGAYRWQKRFLQALQCGSEPRQWVLKSPDHVHSLEGLFAVFPDAVIIQTHRNPFEVLRSSTELTRVLQGLYAWAGDRDEVAAREIRALAEGTERFIQFRDEHPELAGRFIDLKYTDLINDPMAAVAQIYRQMDTPMSEEASNRMRCLASQRSRYNGARQRFTYKGSESTSAKEARRLEQYCARFGVDTLPG